MFLFQKLEYNYKHLDIKDIDNFKYDVQVFIKKMINEHPKYVVFDTETTGLNTITDTPFLIAFGFNKEIISFEFDQELVTYFFKLLTDTKAYNGGLGLGAHNCKFDYHMLLNGGVTIPEIIPLFDSKTIALLTEYTDTQEPKSLKYLGEKYVDENAKFAGAVIEKLVRQINKEKRDDVRKLLSLHFPLISPAPNSSKITKVLEEYEKRVQFVDDNNEVFQAINKIYQPANYHDVYLIEPHLVKYYAADDIAILLEYLNKIYPILEQVDIDFKVTKREGELIRVVAEMERVGFKVDIDYLLNSREKIVNYRDKLYQELQNLTKSEFSVGQHAYIKKLFLSRYDIKLDKSDEKALKTVIKANIGEPVRVAELIIELRTVDKWLSTYIDGKLNSVINGRLHTSIDNNGAISGRVSSDLQQQPRLPLYNFDQKKAIEQLVESGFIEAYSQDYEEMLKEAELFHPRQMFVTDPDYNLYFIDESQMELRVQAYYTILVAPEPDLNLCRAYIPYQCYRLDSGLKQAFNFNSIDDLKSFHNYQWYQNENDELWTPTDLHSQTTKHAFPDVPENSAEFKKKRHLGKTSNFLKVYQGGIKALMETLDIDRTTAEALDRAFYQSFPQVRAYQDWVNKNASLYGYVENLYGRRYYMKSSKWYYKLCNYLIQGTCADMVKIFQINIHKYLKENNYQSKMILPVHDELIFLVKHGEEHIISEIKAIMENTYDTIKNIPMVAEVSSSVTNWRDKKGK